MVREGERVLWDGVRDFRNLQEFLGFRLELSYFMASFLLIC
ncbi:unnamed protein product [Coffea canephora]|uniref:Uncharacterized protein n=1 Tax=Coffea canephora TaxID=49390 RepID=A0A068V288_COFCA|nr:unnamed protein product [Coffea canephora]